MTSTARPAVPLLAALLAAAGLAGCPETFFSQTCPTGSKNEGTFTTTFSDTFGAKECRVTADADGGPADASLRNTPSTFSATLCSQAGADGGPPVLYMATGTGLPRQSPIGDGGTFAFTSANTVTGTICICAIEVKETISGTLLPASGSDAGVTYDADAGLESLRGFTAALVDEVDGGSSCHCNVPCTIEYRLDGVRAK